MQQMRTWNNWNNIIQGQLVHEWAKLEEQGKRLADAACSSDDADLHLQRNIS